MLVAHGVNDWINKGRTPKYNISNYVDFWIISVGWRWIYRHYQRCWKETNAKSSPYLKILIKIIIKIKIMYNQNYNYNYNFNYN